VIIESGTSQPDLTEESQKPIIVKTNPKTFSTNVSPGLKQITVTFDQQMMDNSWSWTGGGETYPKTGKPFYNANKKTCTLPVKLEPGKVYWIGINSVSFKNFQNEEGIPADWYVILFATKTPDGKPTQIPKDMLEKAKKINMQARKALSPIVNKSQSDTNDTLN
jgi:RNA polymerase sigma-70 factor (ECF subfamily)